MNPLIVAQVIQGIVAIMTTLPKLEPLVKSAKDFIQQLVNAGLIPKEAQDATWAYVEAQVKIIESGAIPPSWQVEPD